MRQFDFVTGAADRRIPRLSRRRLLEMLAAFTLWPVSGSLRIVHASAVAPGDLRFRVMYKQSPIGVHTVTFRADGDRLVVRTHVEIAVKVLFFTVFHFKHDAEEIMQAGRLIAVESTTDDNGTRLRVSGSTVEDRFRVFGVGGPFLASAHLLTSNALWDSRILRAERLIDVQYGGEIGLVVRPLGEVVVDTPQGQVRAVSNHIITPHFAGTVFHDNDGRWVKGLIEAKGQIIEYVLAA